MPADTTISTIPSASRTGIINTPIGTPLPVPVTLPGTGTGTTAPVAPAVPLTSGEQAAGTFGGFTPFSGTGSTVNKIGDPLGIAKRLGLPHSLTGPLTLGGLLFKHNRPAIGDIAAATAAGHPITDAQWAKAGYGPGGTDLLTKIGRAHG